MYLPRTLLGFCIPFHRHCSNQFALVRLYVCTSLSQPNHQPKNTRSYWNALNVYLQLSRRHSLSKFHFNSLLRFNELLSARLLHRYNYLYVYAERRLRSHRLHFIRLECNILCFFLLFCVFCIAIQLKVIFLDGNVVMHAAIRSTTRTLFRSTHSLALAHDSLSHTSFHLGGYQTFPECNLTFSLWIRYFFCSQREGEGERATNCTLYRITHLGSYQYV